MGTEECADRPAIQNNQAHFSRAGRDSVIKGAGFDNTVRRGEPWVVLPCDGLRCPPQERHETPRLNE